ncbi:hypothetical protein MMC26_006377 [Xylographa opegraphella]|nr:hypothetical protein [Xylographa opegraphella]
MFVATPRRRRGVKRRGKVDLQIAPKTATEKTPPRLPRSDQRPSVLQNNASAGQPPHTAIPSSQRLPGRLPGHQWGAAPEGPPTTIPKRTRTDQAPEHCAHETSRIVIQTPQIASGNAIKPTQYGMENGTSGAEICDLISCKFNAVITSIDEESFSGDERELIIHPTFDPGLRGGWGFSKAEVSRTANKAISTAVASPKSSNYFAKVNLYANSQLPPDQPKLKLYIPSYPLICLAAQYSQRVYTKPSSKEREAHVNADWRMGTKAMVIKSIPIDDMNAVVFAIRGSQTFMDWAVNLRSAPSSPADFLDDPGNLCHSGFLSVARKMIQPVAARLRSLLEENPSRSTSSLILTGHSAGGAVASLLYAHMMAGAVRSELNLLTGCFKHIHCITFGSPPVALLPLSKSSNPRYRKSLFLSFINEGDPVPRADRAYIRSLFDLYASPAPGSSCIGSILPSIPLPQAKSRFRPLRRKLQKVPAAPVASRPLWHIPPGSLSNAGRLVVLRGGASRREDDMTAVVTSDQQLRGVVYGDPMMHMMKVYARRVELLATKAITAKVWGDGT